ncbi:CAP domain-containing protein [Mycobacterium manitobense]|uniref:CAP domain-containing protein n=1 Tax=[Mycobacterium] manitobense TaxID=190147 RepID=A0A9X2YRV1_9MYCO|nr:CAP domain-containing protein [[Mycobacterium] manitobense]MCV7172390.1 CAP domain-containing protein [[Mycobacterium] manitobense]
MAAPQLRRPLPPSATVTRPLLRSAAALACFVVLAVSAAPAMPLAGADNARLNDSVVANVYRTHYLAGCGNDVTINPPLRLAAEWHTRDVLANRNLNGDIGSDGSTVQSRARAAGFPGDVAQTVAINPALAINGLEIVNQWYSDPADLAIMRDCRYTAIGVWSENSLDRSVVVAVYGRQT